MRPSQSNTRRINAVPNIEALEPRMLLSIGVYNPLPTAPLTPLLAHVRDQIESVMPDDYREVAMPIVDLATQAAGSVYSYLAFPGEANDVKIWGELGNSLLMTNESKDITVFRLGTFNFEPINKIDVKPKIDIAGGGSFVAELCAGLGINVDAAVGSLLKSWFSLSSPRIVSLNSNTLVNLIPGASDILNAFDAFLDFSLSDLIPDDITVIPPIHIFGKKVWDGWTIELPSVFQNIPTVGDLLDFAVPQGVRDVFDGIQDVMTWLQSSFVTDGVYLSLLDGADKADLSTLTGIPETIHGGMGNDVIWPGGGEDLLSSLGVPFRGAGTGRKIKVYGEDGNDVIYVNPNFDSKDTLVDGGTGSDRLVVQGTGGADIFRLIAGVDGMLDEIRFEIDNEQAGNPSNEVQKLKIPDDVTGGTFALKADGWGWTYPLAWNASDSAIEDALAAIAQASEPTLGIDDIEVTKTGDREYQIEFTGELSGQNFSPLVVNASMLERTITAPAVSTERDGNPGDGVGTPVASEVQRISLPDDVTGGTFTLQFDSYPESDPIPVTGGVNDVRLAMLRTGIPGDDFDVTGPYGGPWEIEFTGALELTDVPAIVANGDGLWGALPDWDLARTTPGVEAIDLVQWIDVPDEAVGGTYRVTVTVGSQSRSADVAYNATALELEGTIEALGTVGEGNVNVSRQPDGRFRVEFIEDLGGGAGVAMTVNAVALDGVDINEVQPGGSGDNEIQQIDLAAGAQNGRFRLGFAGQTTAALPTNATSAEIDDALESLSTIGSGNVAVIGPAGGPWTVEFVDSLADTDVALLDAVLVVDAPVETVGVDGINEVQTLTVPAAATGGHMRLIVKTPRGQSGTVIEYDTDAAGLQDALEKMNAVGEGNVEVSGGAGAFTITFTGDLAATPIDAISVDTRFLAGGGVLGVRASSPLTINELQRVAITHADAHAGTFQLQLPNVGTTGDIDFDASPADVEAALAVVVGVGNVAVTGAPRAWEVEFVGAQGAQDVDQLVVRDGQVAVRGGAVEVTELTAGNNGANTTVLATTKFTELKNVEMLEIIGGGGNDTLIVDNSLGAIHFQDGISFSGGGGLNIVTLTSDGTTRAVSSDHKSGKIATSFGDLDTDSQLVVYSSAKAYDLVPADAMSLTTSGGGDDIILEQDVWDSAPVGRLRSSGGPSNLYFANKDALMLSTGGGDDSVTINLGDIPAGLTSLTIDGQGSAAGDSVQIIGTDADEAFDFTPTSMKGGTLAVNVGGVDIDITLAGVEGLAVHAMGHDATADTLTVNVAKASIEPGDYPGTGQVLPRSAAGQPRLGVAYTDVEGVTLLSLDVLAVSGSAGDDVIRVTATQVVVTDIFGDDNIIDVGGALVVALDLMSGNDQVTVDATAALPFQLELLGGGSDAGGDELIFTGSGGDLKLDLDDLSLADGAGAPLTFTGLEVFDIDTVGGGLAVATGADDETLDVTPLDADAGRLALVGTSLTVRYAGLAGLPVAIDLAAGEDALNVLGSAGSETIVLDADGVVFDDGRAASYTGVEAITVLGLQGNDQLDVDNSAGLVTLDGGVIFDGGDGLDLLRLTGSTEVDDSTYQAGPAPGAGAIIHTKGLDRQQVTFTGLEPVIDIVPGPLTVNGTAASNVINGDAGPNSGSALTGGLASVQVWMDGYESIEFAGKTALTINGLGGHDTIDLNDMSVPDGLDGIVLDGGSGNDTLIGSRGGDLLRGDRGNDLLQGASGNDVLLGELGDDTLEGGLGDDLIDGGFGNDILRGDAGDDTARFGATDDDDVVHLAVGAVGVNEDANTIETFEHLTVETYYGDDTVTMDVRDGFVHDTMVEMGDDDDYVEIDLANPGPDVAINVDGGYEYDGDTGLVRGATGDDQFDVLDPLYLFGDSAVSFSDVENRSVLEGAHLDSDPATREAGLFTFVDGDGNRTTVGFTGPGYADVWRDIINGRGADIHSIYLGETVEAASNLTVSVRRADGSDGETSIGRIDGAGAGAINAPNSDLLRGMHLDDGIVTLTLDDIFDDADIEIGGTSGRRVTLTADRVGDVDWVSARLLDLTVSSWDDGTIQASGFGEVVATDGGFGADLINTRESRGGYGLRLLSVTGGDLVTNIQSDRIQTVNVTDGNATLNVRISPDVQALRSPIVLGALNVTGGDLLSANILLEPGMGVGRMTIADDNGVGGNVVGTVNIVGSLGVGSVSGDATGTWALGWAGRLTIDGELSADIGFWDADAKGVSVKKLKVGSIRNASVGMPGGAGTVQVGQWVEGGLPSSVPVVFSPQALSAAWVGKLTTGKGGDFQADLILSGDGVLDGKPTLGSVKIGGSVEDRLWAVNGSAGPVKIGGEVNDWYLQGASPGGDGLTAVKSLTLGNVGSAGVKAGDAIGAVKALRWGSGGIEADSIKSLTTTGRKGNARKGVAPVVGTFGADLLLAGQNTRAGKPTLGNTRIAADLDDAVWDIFGSMANLQVRGTAVESAVRTTDGMGKLTLGAAEDSDFFAGIGDGADKVAKHVDDFENPDAKIAGITIRGWKLASGDTTRFLSGTTFWSAEMGKVSLLNANPGGAGYGLFVMADDGEEIDGIRYRDTLTGEKWTWQVGQPFLSVGSMAIERI